MTGPEHYSRFIKKLTKSIKAKHYNIVRRFTDELHAKVRENISMSYHSPSELAKLDHPFARRHGHIQAHGHSPLWSVHVKWGTILLSLDKRIFKSKGMTIGRVGWFVVRPETRYVMEGTVKMISRPVLLLSAFEINLTERFRSAVLEAGIRGMMN